MGRKTRLSLEVDGLYPRSLSSKVEMTLFMNENHEQCMHGFLDSLLSLM
jgi:hypothetical protein